MRKSPYRHKVHSHKRQGRLVHQYMRGKGPKVIFTASHRSPAVYRKRRIFPMLAGKGTKADIPLHSYAEQRKLDGTRCIIIKEGNKVWLMGRSWKTDYSGRFPEIVVEIKKLSVKKVVLDSELTFFKPGTDIDVFLTALAKPETKAKYFAKVMVFDVLYLEGQSVKSKPFEERQYIINDVVPRRLRHVDVVKTITGRKAKVKYWEDITKGKHGEGVVLKELGSRYKEMKPKEPRGRAWLKVKEKNTDEVVILGFTHGTGERKSTFGSLILGQLTKKGWRLVGKTSGFTKAQRYDLYRRFQKIKIAKTPIQVGKIPSNVKGWVRPKIVAEVEFYERTRHGMYRMPDYIKERYDKRPRDVRFER